MTINKKLMRLHEQIEELKSRFCWNLNCQEWDCDGCSASDDDMRGEEE